jgi:uncharacterized protein involved in outer membrane biogenesis
VLKKVLLGVLGLVLVAGLGLFVWVRAVLGSDRVRTALAGQISETLGQPVAIASISATVFPRLGVTLGGVTIGASNPIEVTSLNVATDFRALLSRRIEHATLRLSGARVPLPLPPLTLMTDTPASDTGAPVELVSIDHIILTDVDIVSGGHTIRGQVEIVPRGQGVIVRNVTLTARDMTLTASGEITDIGAPAGALAIKAGALDFDQLLAMANDFAASGLTAAPATAGTSAPPAASAEAPEGLPLPSATAPQGLPLPASAAPPPSAAANVRTPMNLRVTIEAEKATMSGLTIDAVSAQAIANDELVSLSPLAFNVFGGRYEGSLSVTLRTPTPTFRWIANLSNVDVAKATAYAGSPDTASGTLTGKIDLTGSGTDAAAAMTTARGVVRLDVKDGIVRNLGLVRSVGAATSLSIEGLQRAAIAAASNTDEPFQRLEGTVNIGDGVATTNNLQFEATDLTMAAQGSAQLDGRAMNMKAQLQLSEALSREVNSKMLKLSQKEGRVTLPATISGTFAAPSVKIDTGAITRRAIANTATEEAPKLIRRGIGGLIRR